MALTSAMALHRFGMGAALGETALVARDPEAWLWRQTETRPPPADRAALRRAFRGFAAAASAEDKRERRRRMRALFKRVRLEFVREFGQNFALGALSETPFVERLVWFWTNHFTVSVKGKARVLPFAPSYQADAIRPHALGRFEDMLIAVEQHPAMQIYLDNALSVGPNSAAGRRNDRDLNENLAREILELHTVGVDGGYGQRDVIALAKLLTGWTVPLGPRAARVADPFLFAARRHEPGEKTVLGQRYLTGRKEGERALRDLARRPETARFVAGKLCRHFIADAPPRAAVDHVASRWLASGGDLRLVARALIEAAGFADAATAKFRAPADHLAAAIRALGPDVAPPAEIAPTLIRWGQGPYLAGSPAGYSDAARDLASPDAVVRRLEWAAAAGRRTSIDVNPLALARDLFAERLSPATATAITGAESPADALALLLVSPEFMWR